jgi:hypothetical protein
LKLLLDRLKVPSAHAGEVQRLICRLCPSSDLLNEALMGVWIGVGVDPANNVGFKVYVNEEPVHPSVAYLRLASCLSDLDRPSALYQLRAFLAVAETKVAPRGIAVELLGDEIGRVKLYMRTSDASSRFLTQSAEALGCKHVVERLSPFAKVMNAGDGFDPRAVTLSLEFAHDGCDTCFKVDVNCIRFFQSDQAVDSAVRQLLTTLGFDDSEYSALLTVVAPQLSPTAVDRFTWLGTALRPAEQRVNVYLHPGSHT